MYQFELLIEYKRFTLKYILSERRYYEGIWWAFTVFP